MKKKVLFLSLLFVVMIALTGCDVKDKVFKKDNFKITLTDEFEEDKFEGADYYFISKKSGLTVLEEKFDDLEEINLNEESSLDEYAKAVLKANNRDTEVKSEDNFSYFTYNTTVNETTYYHMSVLKKGENGFWLINFFGKYSDHEELEPKFLKYAETIKA